MPQDWTRAEVEVTVADYLDMLEAELAGRDYNETEHRRALSKLLANRTDGAIERKHQNISDILIDLGLPYVDGYKPLRNYQQLLYEIVADRVAVMTHLLAHVAEDVMRTVVLPTVDDILAALVSAPEPAQRPGLYRERRAARPIHVLSFDETGRERLVEVKTTSYGQHTPFLVTHNELQVSHQNAGQYHTYRVFGFRKNPRLFQKRGAWRLLATGAGSACSSGGRVETNDFGRTCDPPQPNLDDEAVSAMGEQS